mmetsp:Transcript_41685/g.75698  ORF Transcript_41685/g.75698 Transcript_41685/m.75698 type:complete len:933 (+) Transcript_41685:100-2898(+)
MFLYFRYFIINLLATAVTPCLILFLFSAIGEGAAAYRWLSDQRDLRWPSIGLGMFILLYLYLFDYFLGWPPPDVRTTLRFLYWSQETKAAETPKVTVPAQPMVPSVLGRILLFFAACCLALGWMFWAHNFPSGVIILSLFTGPAAVIFWGLVEPDKYFERHCGRRKVMSAEPSMGSIRRSLDAMKSKYGLSGRTSSFMTAQASALALHALWLLFLWGFWVTDNNFLGGENAWGTAVKERLARDGISEESFGGNQELVQAILWMSPLTASLVLFLLSAMVMFNLHLHRRLAVNLDEEDQEEDEKGEKMLSLAEMRQISNFAKSIKLFTTCLVLLAGATWATASVAGASIQFASTCQAFIAALFFFLVIYIYFSLNVLQKDLLMRGMSVSPLIRNARNWLVSDLGMALFLTPTVAFMPFYLVLSFLNQQVRKIRCSGDYGEDKKRWLTPVAGTQLSMLINRQDWTSVHRYLQILCIVVVSLQVLGGIGTNVFLSWVNEQLAGTSFGTLVMSFMLVGISMFMIPIVPGVAVYFFGGILIPQGWVRTNTELGPDGLYDYSGSEFWVGFLIVVCLNFSQKLIAVTLQQKTIGEPMSTNTTILQMVGVNKPGMKAVEVILRKPGFTVAKVAILVGGPDWPTSVLTGIMRLSLFQMLLGTTPVIVNVSIVTAAGAFKLREPESHSWESFSSLILSIALCINILLTGTAAYYIQETWESYSEFLRKPRRQHLPLDWLDHVAKKQQEVIKDFTAWQKLGIFPRLILVLTSVLFVSSTFVMCMLSSLCWDEFKVTDPFDGLNFMKPIGAGALSVFAFCCILHWMFGKWVSCGTRAALREIASKMEPEREAWIEKRAEEVEEEAADPDQDLRLVVLQLQGELHALQERVRSLEKGAKMSFVSSQPVAPVPSEPPLKLEDHTKASPRTPSRTGEAEEPEELNAT